MEKTSEKTQKPKKNKFWLLGILMFVIFIAIISGFIYWFFSQSQTTTSGQFADPESSEDISCTGENIDYPYFELANTSKTSIKINATFQDDNLNVISMYYSLYYSNSVDIAKEKASSLAKINLATQEEDLGSYIFNFDLRESNGHLDARFFANAKDITSESAKYLLLPTPDNNNSYSKETIINHYQSLGLECTK